MIQILILTLASLAFSQSTYAYVSGAVSAAPGEWDLQLRSSFERGLLGSQNIPESQIKERASISEYTLRGGTNLGTHFGLQDFSTHMSGSYLVHGAEFLNGVQTYSRDTGYLLGAEISGNFVHEPPRQVGFLIRGSAPVGLRTEKFGKLRIDSFALGLQSGFQIGEQTQFENLTYYGSGYSKDGVRHQNAALVFSGLFGIRLRDFYFPGTILKAGPFFESDLTERSDQTYGLVGFRGYRVGLSAIAAIQIQSDLSLELGYIQKLSGSYFRATNDIFASLNMVF